MTVDPNYTRIREDVLSDLGWSDDDPKVAALSLGSLQKLLGGDPTGFVRDLVLNSSSAEPIDANAVTLIVANALLGSGSISVLYDDAAKTITISTTATVNSSDGYLLSRSNHTGTQNLDTTTDSATRLAMAANERTKLAGIAAGATVNSTDASLRDRSTHTGTQLAATISDLTAAITNAAGAKVLVLAAADPVPGGTAANTVIIRKTT